MNRETISGELDVARVNDQLKRQARIKEIIALHELDLHPSAILFYMSEVSLAYPNRKIVEDINFVIPTHKITTLMGPSGCGKSSVLRVMNRLFEIQAGKVQGEVFFHGQDIYSQNVDPVQVRRRIGMVFQKPNPFNGSIFDNVAEGPRLLGIRDKAVLKETVEASLDAAALLKDVKNRQKDSALSLSVGQQQRLCLARALAIQPDILLLDEPSSALDPISTARIEKSIRSLVDARMSTVVMVTHDLMQAEKISDFTGFMTAIGTENNYVGKLIEFGDTYRLFKKPREKLTEDYIKGGFG